MSGDCKTLTEGGTSQSLRLLVGRDGAGQRLDTWVASHLEGITRSYLQKLIGEGQVLVNQRPAKASYRLQDGDVVEVNIPPPVDLEVHPQEIPLSIVFEDRDLIVVDKPAGMVVHPAAGNYQGTLVNALLAHCRDLSSIG
ncbi:MAG: RluA family pseudouridine synthase, partial [Syntrophomonadaceae bacterium]|nr:RluA family pseudouridine synthase [Syntrophomonadaceae bacterium]